MGPYLEGLEGLRAEATEFSRQAGLWQQTKIVDASYPRQIRAQGRKCSVECLSARSGFLQTQCHGAVPLQILERKDSP